MLRILNEYDEAKYIFLEPPGVEGEGVEFFIGCNNKKEFHQVKRQRSTGSWTPNSLKTVLIKFWDKLKEDGVICKFISAISATDLYNLSENARSSSSYTQFKNHFLSSKPLKTTFKNICEIWNNPSPQEAYNAIKKIWFIAQDEMELCKVVNENLSGIVKGNPNNVRSALFEYVFNNIHKKLNAHGIWNYLIKSDYHPHDWYKDSSVIGIINRMNESYEQRLKSLVSYMIPKSSVEDILKKIQSNEDVIITGPAGIGKSTVILQILDHLKRKHVPFITLNIDTLNVAFTALELGKNLGLPNSPGAILNNIAQNERCVLIIDQLDNVSMVPATRPQFFDCIYDTIKKAKLFPNISLILACRNFDLENDHRFKDLIKKFKINKVKIDNLSIEQIKDYLMNLGLDYSRFDSSHFEILSVPLHLRLLSEIAKSSDDTSFTFDSVMDLYREYWKIKKKNVKIRIGDSTDWNKVIKVLCKYMSNNQVLSVHEDFLDDYSEVAEAMASEGVLIYDSRKYSFFHRDFFDYAFARRFIIEKSDISILTDDEQHLFRRSQVKQILLYERTNHPKKYFKDLKFLLNSKEVRFHIKRLILNLLSGFEDPKEEEWDVISKFMNDMGSDLYSDSWAILFGSMSWFKLLDSLGVFQEYLDSDNNQLIVKTMHLFGGVIEQTDRVAELIKPYVNKSVEWNELIIDKIVWADLRRDPYYELFLHLIDNGIFESTKRYHDNDYWDDIQYTIINKLNEGHPERSIKIFSHYLNEKLEKSIYLSQKNPFYEVIPTEAFEGNIITKMADKSPETFVDEILPIMLHLMEFNALKEGDKPWKDNIWRFKYYYGDKPYNSDELLLYSMEIALRKLASIDKRIFKRFEDILKNSDYETAHYLLIRSYYGNGRKYSDSAVDYLYANPNSLKIGYLNYPNGASMFLIKSISPHCSYLKFKKLEKLLLTYFTLIPDYYKWVCTFHHFSCEDFRSYEFRNAKAQLNLLECIPVSLRSVKVRSRINELSKIYDISAREPTEMKAVRVSSPIKEEKARVLTDDEWLNAISKYDKEGVQLEGGAFELSLLLKKIVKDEPNRFVKLINKFPDNTNVHYFNAILCGITDSNASFDTVMKVCKRCHELPDKPCGMWITQPIAKFAREELTLEALDIVTWYAVNDPDPKEELWNENNSHGQAYYGGNPTDAAINSVRGNAAFSIGKIIYYNKKLIPYFAPTLNKMVKDDSIAVRSLIPTILINMIPHDKHLAITLFNRLCNVDDDILLQTPYIEKFVYYNLKDNFRDVSNIIHRMLLSPNTDVNVVGAMAVSYASLILGDELPELRFSLYNSKYHRLGVAKAFVDYLPYSNSISLVKNILPMLFSDPSEEVRSVASTCFKKIDNNNIKDYEDLIRDFIYNSSGTFKALIYSLNKIIDLPDITIEVCEQFFKLINNSKVPKNGVGTSATAMKVSELVFRLYGQTKNNETRLRCLDLIDCMLKKHIPKIERTLSQYEND